MRIFGRKSTEEKMRDTERGFEIGMDEAWKTNMKMLFDFTLANMKRTYDEYQNESLTGVRENRSYVDKVLSDAQQNDNFKQSTANQALQNAVETANMVSKQAVRHADIAIDRQWNIDEVAHLIAKNPIFMDAIAAKVVDAVNK